LIIQVAILDIYDYTKNITSHHFKRKVEDIVMKTTAELKVIAKDGLRGKWGQAIGAALLTYLVSEVPLCAPPMMVGYAKYNLKVVRKENRDVGEVFSGFDVFGKALWLYIITAFFIYLWSLLFIIPGIVKSFAYAMAPYILAEDGTKTARQALNESKILMQGKKGHLFYLGLTFIGWYLLGCLSFGVALLWIMPYMSATLAAFYDDAKAAGVPLQ
jgi:uncharacterized membrane protein